MAYGIGEIVVPLVGAYHRPPARQLIAALPAGSRAKLVSETSNPYDEKAVQVWLFPQEVPEEQRDALSEALIGTGYTLQELLEAEAGLQAGYVADSDGKACLKNGWNGNREVRAMLDPTGTGDWADYEAKLQFDDAGKPFVHIKRV